jgi:acetyltransferase EpsM
LNSVIKITIPLLNTNEPEALLSDLFVQEGQKVSKDDILCTLETTKSVSEITAESNGFIIGLRLQKGATVKAGDLFCYIAEKSTWQPPVDTTITTEKDLQESPKVGDKNIPAELRITQPALNLANKNNLDINALPIDRLITEKYIREIIQGKSSQEVKESQTFDPTKIIIYGGGGHGKALIELIQTLNQYQIVGIVDDGIPKDKQILGYPVLGGSLVLRELYRNGTRLAVNAVGGIGNLKIRVKVFQELIAAGFSCPAVIHPTAFIERSAIISDGVQIFPHAYIGTEVSLGFGSIVNTGAIISHDCKLGDYANISPGAILAGEVEIGESVLIGMGVTINLQAKVGKNARIGNGATVKQDIPDGGIVRAGTIWLE